MKKIMIASWIVLGLSSCGADYSNEQAEGMNYSKDAMAVEDMAQSSEVGSETMPTKKLIKTAKISFICTDSQKEELLNKTIQQFNGYVSHSSRSTQRGKVVLETVVKVPAKNYDDFLAAIKKGEGDLDHISESVDDVTTHYIDLKARIENKKAFEKAYHTLMDSAKTVSEMLEIQREIEVLRSDIESYEQQFQYLSESVAYSTFNIQIEYPDKHDSKGNKRESMIIGGLLLVFGIILFFVLRRRN